MIKLSFFVFLGSGIGGVCRYFISGCIDRIFQHLHCNSNQIASFPLGTFVVNIVGCFIIGLIYGAISKGTNLSPEMQTFLAAGFCGGLTTFSTFSHENYLLFQSNHFGIFLTYVLLSLVFGLIAAYTGHAVIK